MAEYTYEDFLNTELEIFAASKAEKTQDNFKAQLQKRLLEFPNIQLHVEGYPKSGDLGEPVLFDVNSEITRAFIKSRFGS